MAMNTTAQTREPLRCRRCGCYQVQWRQTKAGKLYMATKFLGTSQHNEVYMSKLNRQPHNCTMHQHHSEGSERHVVDFEMAEEQERRNRSRWS